MIWLMTTAMAVSDESTDTEDDTDTEERPASNQNADAHASSSSSNLPFNAAENYKEVESDLLYWSTIKAISTLEKWLTKFQKTLKFKSSVCEEVGLHLTARHNS